MAKHDFLHVLGLESLKSDFPRPVKTWGRVQDGISNDILLWSGKIKSLILEEFRKQPSFLRCDPVITGSLARGEICPGSDLDFVFLGPESAVAEFVGWAQGKGLKIRSRVPEDHEDLSKGVELWDLLSLLDGEALTPKGEKILERERLKIVLANMSQKKKWLKRLLIERKARHERYDSIQNLLEPSIKMGLGGLRDLDQARLILKSFPEIEIEDPHVLRLLEFYLHAFLWIRCKLHLEGQRDLISNQSQPQLAEFFRFSDYREFMFFVQRGLSRVSFYTDWILEIASRGQRKVELKELKRPADLTRALLHDPGVLTQYRVRRLLDVHWSSKSLDRRRAERGRELRKFFAADVGQAEWLALFRSRLMDRLVPELKALVGLVQHDQYHRYAADAHLLQVIRETLKARKSVRHLGPIGKFGKSLTSHDWQLLLWTALYHDLAKGRPQEHSDLGAQWVRRDLKAFGLPAQDVNEVEWLVQNHLAFSQAALRRDSQDPHVLRELFELELTDARTRRLLVFTALDILGTNPQAWNEWKAQLLAQLGERLLSADQKREMAFAKKFSFLAIEEQQALFQISRRIGLQRLQRDLQSVQSGNAKTFALFRVKKQIWLRYSKKQDTHGALAEILGLLFQSGVSVLQAFVLTPKKIGIYDWFCLDFSGSSESLIKRLEILSNQKPVHSPRVQWEQLQKIESPSGQTTVLFKGLDQRGLLWSAAESLSQAGLEIQSAVVQTWGSKAEDLFVVKVPKNDPEWFLRLQKLVFGDELIPKP